MILQPTDESRITLVQITDAHLCAQADACLLGMNTDRSLQGVIRHLGASSIRPDLLLATGDISQDGSVAANRRFLELAGAIPAPVFGLPGNHDRADSFQKAWAGKMGPAIDIGPWRIILLDSTVAGANGGHLAADQLHMLEAAANAAGGRHVLVALHHNPIPMGSRWLDTMMLDNASDLFNLLQRLPDVRGLLWGHVHQEYDGRHRLAAASGGGSGRHIRLLSSPSTCVQFAPLSRDFAVDTAAPGYRWLQLLTDGTIKSGVERADTLNLDVDMQSTGY